MSRVATISSLEDPLNDYQIRLTGDEAPTENTTRGTSSSQIQNPASWPTDYHGVPPYRPVDTARDLESRRGSNPVENAFIFVMLHGVWLNATIAQTWRKTGGRLNNSYFRYAIGGEW